MSGENLGTYMYGMRSRDLMILKNLGFQIRFQISGP
jgi:hypothetical protein